MEDGLSTRAMEMWGYRTPESVSDAISLPGIEQPPQPPVVSMQPVDSPPDGEEAYDDSDDPLAELSDDFSSSEDAEEKARQERLNKFRFASAPMQAADADQLLKQYGSVLTSLNGDGSSLFAGLTTNDEEAGNTVSTGDARGGERKLG